jgi:hypothetical protein
MERYLEQSERTDDAMLMISESDHGCRGFSPTGWSEWRTGRWAVVGVLALTLGAWTLGLVYTSRTQLVSVVRTSTAPATPSPTLHSSTRTPDGSRRRPIRMSHARRRLPLSRTVTASPM